MVAVRAAFDPVLFMSCPNWTCATLSLKPCFAIGLIARRMTHLGGWHFLC